MYKENIDKNELIERFNEFMETYKMNYLIPNEFLDVKPQTQSFSLNETNKLQQDILSFLDENKINNCKINLCNKKNK